MAIPAQDVNRCEHNMLSPAIDASPRTNLTLPASEFYQTVFKLPFKEHKSPTSECADRVKLFDFSSAGVNLSGGILKAPDNTGVFNGGKGGICVHWFVEDVDATAKIIEGAGGKMLSEKQKEGEHGMYRYFEDTEGTVGAIYMMV